MRLTLVVTLVEALVTLGASLLFLLTPATTAHRSRAGPRDEDVRRPYEALGPRRRAFASWLQRAGTSLRGRLALAVLRWRTSEAAGSRHRLRPRPAVRMAAGRRDSQWRPCPCWVSPSSGPPMLRALGRAPPGKSAQEPPPSWSPDPPGRQEGRHDQLRTVSRAGVHRQRTGDRRPESEASRLDLNSSPG
jgi:hypothetical protein